MTTSNNLQRFASIYFRLPDERLVLQRRTKDAQHAPGMLGAFGGWVENGETVEEGLIREIKEETSLRIEHLRIKPITEFLMPADKYFEFTRQFYIFEADINDMDFEVYEGQGVETFFIDELRNRNDLNSSAEYLFKTLDIPLLSK